MKAIFRNCLFLFVLCTHTTLISQNNQANWDSIKSTISPVIAPAFAGDYHTPYRMPLSAYGWEDGIHVSRDGHHLYALYYPGDLLSWTMFFQQNVATGSFCDLFGETGFLRPYAAQYGMDMTTNPFGCDTFLNIDILYSNRALTTDSFQQWQLSNLARPGMVEGGSYPLQSANHADSIDIFLMTGNSEIWMIRNTGSNPSNIQSAIRLPYPINPLTNEFFADNPHLERLSGDTLLMVYEKYTNGEERDFMYVYSYDFGYNWETPVAMQSINYGMGKIEHPHLFRDQTDGNWYIYFSLQCEIYRARQAVANDWDSWQNIELVIGKGNSPCIGEPSLTKHGDISFALVYAQNVQNNDTTDLWEIDPWYVRHQSNTQLKEVGKEMNAVVFPNPFKDEIKVRHSAPVLRLRMTDLTGRVLMEDWGGDIESKLETDKLPPGVYLLQVESDLGVRIFNVVKGY